MTRIYALPPSEGWIVDRIAAEFSAHCSEAASSESDADVVWAAAGWCTSRVTVDRPIVASVHHVCKSEHRASVAALDADPRVTAIHVPCEKTRVEVCKLTSKPVITLPYWIDLDRWRRSDPEQSRAVRAALGVSPDAYVVGSFQRDTEGADLVSPKLEKGPDIFVQHVERMARQRSKLVVLLAGWRRQYVCRELAARGIEHRLVELAPLDLLKTLYCSLDLYVVSSRCEGGPQALLECSALRVPIVSRDVGMSRDVLAPMSVNDDLSIAIPDVSHAAAKIVDFDVRALVPRYAAEIGRFAR